MNNKKALVVVPFYKTILTYNENVSLQQCFKILSAYDIVAIKPHNLLLPPGVTELPFTNVLSFNNDYFTSIQGYNQLMLSADFYGTFLAYEYMLIYQLDAFVFKDELTEWCSKNIDYVGPPWIRPRKHTNIIQYLKPRLNYYIYMHLNKAKMGINGFDELENRVGNGGLSLRRIEKFYNLCETMRPQIDIYNNHTQHQFNEDVFWSLEVKRAGLQFNIPGYKEALKFAFEIGPERARLLNNGQLPFGCHAWDINIDYWRPIFAAYGHSV